MTIQSIGSGSAVLYITAADLKERGLTPAQLTLEEALELARSAFAKSGMPLEGPIEIEAYPEACGVLVFARWRRRPGSGSPSPASRNCSLLSVPCPPCVRTAPWPGWMDVSGSLFPAASGAWQPVCRSLAVLRARTPIRTPGWPSTAAPFWSRTPRPCCYATFPPEFISLSEPLTGMV